MDWVAFLEAHDVPFVTSGPNTKKGNISIQCPWCGEDDPSEHLSISLTKDAYGCWRDARHAGKQPWYLVAALLNCSPRQARLTVQQFNTPDPESLEEVVEALGGAITPTDKPEPPAGLPASFKPIKPTGLTGRFWRYLERRGFDNVAALTQRYGLLCCQTGRYKDRVIVPLYSEGKLVGWTGRAIQRTVNAPRYLSSSPEIKELIFNEDKLKGGDQLIITEGPFDALKVDYYGREADIWGTCLFGVVPVPSQIAILRRVIKRFRRSSILFDANAQSQAMTLSDYLSAGVEIDTLPAGVGDPGKMTRKQVLNIHPLTGR